MKGRVSSRANLHHSVPSARGGIATRATTAMSFSRWLLEPFHRLVQTFHAQGMGALIEVQFHVGVVLSFDAVPDLLGLNDGRDGVVLAVADIDSHLLETGLAEA